MTFQDAKKYLDSFVNYEKTGYNSKETSFKLARIQSLLSILDNPQERIRFLHVAGTKGKGSTCAFLAYILREAGFRVGFYTSPHLSDFRERIRILAKGGKGDLSGMISPREVIEYVRKLQPAVERLKKNSRHGDLTFFEIYTALAILYFKEKQVDFAVLETGLGGRLDATNAVNPLVAGITPVSYEHTQILGKTLAKIAGEKAGIIKNERQIVVSAPQSKEARRVIEARCHKFHARLFSVGKEISFRAISANRDFQTFSVKSIFRQYPVLKSRLLGSHQLINAATAVGMIEALRFCGIDIPGRAIRDGIARARWPGRLETVRRNPRVILDGAQNVASCQALKTALKEISGNKKVILILGISQDKDLKGICRELKGIAREIILTQADSQRATLAEKLKPFFSRQNKVSLTRNLRQAMSLAFNKAHPGDLILVTGSLFVVGEARRICLN
jgi:dihydrofolate synthase / folylpolyglutamate synthase